MAFTVDMDQPSHMMLMEPASKVSVPLTVVMRTRSRTPDKVMEPADRETDGVETEFIPVTTHVFPVIFSTRNDPIFIVVADVNGHKAMPVVKADVVVPC